MVEGTTSSGSAAAAALFENKGVEVSADMRVSDKRGDAPSTAPKFGEVWQQIQSKYGAKEEKPRVAKKALDKDDFLRIMITQMRHQDPTSPMQAEKFATELAQFTSVEQLQNLNQGMAKMAKQNQPLERMAMTNLIGKSVTVDRERFIHSEGAEDALNFGLSRDAEAVRVTILNEAGAPVFEKDLGKMKTGDNTFVWDGKQGNGLPVKPGNFIFRVEAVDENGKKIQMDTRRQANVIGVSFEGTEPALLVGNPARPDKIAMRNISRIDSTPGGAAPAVAGPMHAPVVNSAMSGANVNVPAPGTQPGVAPPDRASLIEMALQAGRAQQQAAGPAMAPSSAPAAPAAKPAAMMAQSPRQNPAPFADEEKGFPNGLSESNP